MVTRIKAVTVLASFIAWVLVANLPAYANGIVAWSCVNDAGNQKLILTTASPVSRNAKVAIDGVEKSQPCLYPEIRLPLASMVRSAVSAGPSRLRTTGMF